MPSVGPSFSCKTSNNFFVIYCVGIACFHVVAGFGFGVMSGAFSLVNVLADMTGPGTVGIFGHSADFFVTSGYISSISCWLYGQYCTSTMQ